MDAAGYERVPERVHLHHGGGARSVAEVVGVAALGERRARSWLDGDDARVLPVLQVLADKGESHATEVRAPADAADDHVGIFARQFHLLQCFLSDHRLVQEHVVQNAPERVFGVVVLDCVLDRFAYGYTQRSWRVRMLLEDVAACLREVRGTGEDLCTIRLHHDASVGFLVVADTYHIDRAIQAHHAAGEGDGRAPLARPGLRGQAPDTLLAVVVGLRDGRVRLVAARRADTFVLVVDVGRSIE